METLHPPGHGSPYRETPAIYAASWRKARSRYALWLGCLGGGIHLFVLGWIGWAPLHDEARWTAGVRISGVVLAYMLGASWILVAPPLRCPRCEGPFRRISGVFAQRCTSCGLELGSGGERKNDRARQREQPWREPATVTSTVLLFLLTLASVVASWGAAGAASSLVSGRNVSDVGIPMWEHPGASFALGTVTYFGLGAPLAVGARTLLRYTTGGGGHACWWLLALGAIPLFLALAFAYG